MKEFLQFLSTPPLDNILIQIQFFFDQLNSISLCPLISMRSMSQNHNCANIEIVKQTKIQKNLKKIIRTKIQNAEMQKQKSRSKHDSTQKRKKLLTCTYCQSRSSNTQLPQVVTRNLVKKYNDSIGDETASSEFNCFMSGLSVSYAGGVRQFLVGFQPIGKEYIQQYYDINQIKVNITQLVRTIAWRFQPNLIHFHDPFFSIKRKQQIEMLKKNNHHNLDLFNNSLIKHAQIYSGSEIDGMRQGIQKQKNLKNKSKNKSNSKSKNKHSFKAVNQSELQIQKLCRNIGSMCSKVPQQKSKNRFKDKLMMISKQKRKQSKEEAQFKNNLLNNFSVIQKQEIRSQQKSKKSISRSKQVEQLYGISNKKPRAETKMSEAYSSKRAETQKIQLLADSPVTQAYYIKEYNYTQTAGPIKPRKKQRKQKRYSFSPYSIKNKKSLSKPKSDAQGIVFKLKSKSNKVLLQKK